MGTKPKAEQHRIIDGVCCICGPGVKVYTSSNRNRCAKPTETTKQAHGLTTWEAREFVEGKVCAMCGSDKKLVVDHDHKTGKVRGALCHRHNIGIGLFQDDIEQLETAIAYIKHHREVQLD